MESDLTFADGELEGCTKALLLVLKTMFKDVPREEALKSLIRDALKKEEASMAALNPSDPELWGRRKARQAMGFWP